MAAAACLFGLSACGAVVLSRAQATLVVGDLPPGARVFVDDVPVLAVGRITGAVPLAPGLRRVGVIAPGYLPVRADVDAIAGAEYSLLPSLWPCFEELDRGCVGPGALPTGAGVPVTGP